MRDRLSSTSQTLAPFITDSQEKSDSNDLKRQIKLEFISKKRQITVAKRRSGFYLEFCCVQTRFGCVFDEVFKEELVFHDSLNWFDHVIIDPQSVTKTLCQLLRKPTKQRVISKMKLLSLLMKSYGVTIQTKPLQQYFCMVTFVFQYFTK